MGVREALNRNGTVTVAVASAAIIGLGILIYVQATAKPPEATPPSFWFSSDDGQTVFPAPMDRVPPFMHEGREAVRAYVGTVDGGQSKVIRYLEKYTPTGKEALEAVPFEARADVMASLGDANVLVKSPGPGAWVPKTHPSAQEIYRKNDRPGMKSLQAQ
jgi:hypothetical protein